MSRDRSAELGVSLIRVDDGRLEISGDLLFESAIWLRAEGEKVLPAMGKSVVVDLRQVGRVASVGISVLLCWLRMAQVLGKELKFVNSPDDMLDISRVSSLDSVIPFAS